MRQVLVMKIGLVMAVMVFAFGVILVSIGYFGNGDTIQSGSTIIAVGLCTGGILTAIDEATTLIGCHIFNKRCACSHDSSSTESVQKHTS